MTQPQGRPDKYLGRCALHRVHDQGILGRDHIKTMPRFDFSPDVHPHCRLFVHGVVRRYREGLVKLGHVRQRSIASHLVRAVRVYGQELQSPLFRNVLSPALCPREEEPLDGRESVDQTFWVVVFGVDQSTAKNKKREHGSR